MYLTYSVYYKTKHRLLFRTYLSLTFISSPPSPLKMDEFHIRLNFLGAIALPATTLASQPFVVDAADRLEKVRRHPFPHGERGNWSSNICVRADDEKQCRIHRCLCCGGLLRYSTRLPGYANVAHVLIGLCTRVGSLLDTLQRATLFTRVEKPPLICTTFLSLNANALCCVHNLHCCWCFCCAGAVTGCKDGVACGAQ